MNFKSLPKLLEYFKDEETCRKYFENIRWKSGPVTCIHCGHDKVYRTNRGYKCAKCLKKFSVTVGTIFENTKIPLRTWFAAIWLCTAHKKGVSSLQLGRDLAIPQKTAWFLAHRIREMLKDKNPSLLRNHVQVDETYVGGKNKNRHKNKKKKQSEGRNANDKTPVVGLLEQDGKVIAFVVPDTEGPTLKSLMKTHVEKGSVVVTDAYRSYNGLSDEYKHIVVKHNDGSYVVDSKFHTQNIENFWSIFKRGIIGIYHGISRKHLQRYCEEFTARYNTRRLSEGERFEAFLINCDGIRLKYKDLVAKVTNNLYLAPSWERGLIDPNIRQPWES